MADYSVHLQGFDRAQEAMLRATEAIQPTGALGAAVKEALFMAQAYLIQGTHIITGTYIRSHMIQYDGASGYVTPSPYNINPESHRPPSEYAIYEEARGGDHATYARTVEAYGQDILAKTGLYITKELSDI